MTGYRYSIVGRAAATLLVAFCFSLLTGCEPSPASRALKEKPELTMMGPPPADHEPPAVDEIPEPPIAEAEMPARAPIPEPVISNMVAQVIEPQPAQTAAMGEPSESDEDLPAEMLRAPFELLGEQIPAGTSRRLMWSASQMFEGVSSATPVLIVNGRDEGPTVCLTAAIHGDELNGIEMVRRVLHELDPAKLGGTVIGIPIVNLQGFRRGSRYLPDRRDLNRYFPGNMEGSSASRIAYSLFTQVINRCDALVDLHTGSFYRTNLPQLRADMRYAKVRELTKGFGGMVVLHSTSAPGTLRRAAVDAGIPAVTLEAGEPLRLQSDEVSQGVNGILTLLNAMAMIERPDLPAENESVFFQSTWVRADHGGILFSVVRLGQSVQTGDVLGTVTDPITNEQNLIYSPEKGQVLGMALNQVVMPGFAAFRIGVEAENPEKDPMIALMDWQKKTEKEKPPPKPANNDPDSFEEASE